MPVEIQDWLKNSILGIVLLGAIGSLLAVLLGRIFFAIRRKVLPVPYQAHMKRKERQAYFLGYTHATIEADTNGRMLITFLAFRVSRLLVALVLFLFTAVLASNVLVFQAQVVLTTGLFLSVVVAFLALYWAHFEFEYVYRTYLWLWRKTLEGAESDFVKYKDKSAAEQNDETK